ncbi:MAG: right-handed parallel beta-helix repeat-containing protein, partial [Phycisphaerales bacterium]
MSRMSTFMATCGFCLLTGIAGGQTVLYVDANAPGPTHDGSSWCSAYTDLQDAFDAAAPWDEIHVADGTYTPDRGTGDRSASFELRSAIALYGGYPGCGMPEPQVRDPSAYETILSGDLTGNDAVVTNPQDLPGEATRAENSYHVVVGSGIGASAILDGFTITAGNANGVDDRDKQGGGMRIYSLSNPTVTNCVFRGNSSDGGGGGMMNITNASPTVTGCTFTGNWAERGGGMANFSCANGVVTNCWFTRNAAEEGGAVMNNPSCSGGTTFINCAFSGNWAEIGGAVRNRFSGDPDFVNCVFSGNTGTVSGGGAFYSTDGSSPDLKNCIVWGNIPDQIFGAATVRYTCCSEEWFGIGNITDDPIFYDADGADDMFGTEDDDFRLMDGSPCIDLGANAYVTVDTDLAGFPRIVDGDGDGTPTVDMGAYELQDCNGNDIRDECDLDCGPPGGPCDVPGCGLSADCQPNGTPDECEPDCNANGTPDDCDIVASTSDDCNENGIPDKCEIDISSAAPGGPFYCDPADPPAGLDACDPDCNDDGRPDECGVIDNCLFDFRTFPAALNTNAASDSGHDHYPQLTTDGQGNWLAVWHSHEDLGGTIETDGDILFSISTDNGTTWSAPAPLNTNAASDSGNDWSPQLTTDGQGNWLAVWWSDDDLAGTIGGDIDILFSRSTDNGGSWTATAPLNSNAASDTGHDFSPQLTTDRQGNWLAVWHSGDDLGGTIGTDGDILFSRSTDNGASWTPPGPLNTNAASDSGDDSTPQLTTDGQGNWLAVWWSYDDLGGTIGTDPDILFSVSTDNGASWTPPMPLNTNAASDSGDDSTPQLTTDGQGNWLAVWESTGDLGGTIGTDPDILFSVSTDDGTSWTAPGPLNTNAACDSGDDGRPQLTTDGQGNWRAVWWSQDDLGGTIGTDADILFSASTDSGASWTAPAPLNTNAASDIGHDYRPQLTTDGQGNWRAVWWSDEDLGGAIGTDWDILFSQFRSIGEDCNCNGTADACDIAECAGDPACSDCNDNGIPDECDIADCTDDPACADCNGNGIPDGCDIDECAGDPACDDCND